MNEYEKEMFDFLTKEENMKGLIIAKNQFGTIRSKLLSDFWNLTHQKLVDSFKHESSWEVILQPDITNQFSKLYVSEKNMKRSAGNGLPSFIFCWERLTMSYPYYGFWLNRESQEYKFEKIYTYLLDVKRDKFPGFGKPEEWFPLWDNDKEIDFSNDESLLKIIPGKLENTSEEYCSLLVDLFKSMKEDYAHIKANFSL